jgi:peptidoglycan/LPS O-acetylase OafA/YrhL
VLFHFSDQLFDLLPELIVIGSVIQAGYFAIPLFFVLSGYLLGWRYAESLTSSRALTRYFWLRLGRIYPVHLASLFLTVILVTRNGWPSEPYYSVGSLAANVLMVHAWQPRFSVTWNFPSWSISSEWFAYLIFPVLIGVMSRLGRSTLPWRVIGIAVIAAVLFSIRDSLLFFGLATTVPSFIGGVALARLYPPGSGTATDGRIAAVLLTAAAALPFIIPSGPIQSAAYIVLFFALVKCLGAAGNTGPSWWQHRWIVLCGEISYSLYMTHAIAIPFIASAIPLLVASAPIMVRIAFVGASLILIAGLSVLMHYTVERPARAFSRNARVGRESLRPTTG